jgi:hypothetical protein
MNLSAEVTEELPLNTAGSRNRAVYRFRGSFFGSFLDKQKRTDNLTSLQQTNQPFETTTASYWQEKNTKYKLLCSQVSAQARHG